MAALFTGQRDIIMCDMVDGVIVGSAIVKRIASHLQDPGMIGHVAEFVRSLKVAMASA